MEEYSKLIEGLNPCVDLFITETLCSVREVRAACEALSAVPRPLFIGVSVKDDGSNRLRSGEDLQAALDVAKNYGFIRGLLVNCSSPAAVGAALPLLKAAAMEIGRDAEETVRIGGYANLFKVSRRAGAPPPPAPAPTPAGAPGRPSSPPPPPPPQQTTDEWLGGEAPAVTTEDGDYSGDVMTPAGYAKHVASWIEAGATVVGACCGSTPAHIQACRAAITASA